MKNFSSDREYNLWLLLNQARDAVLKARRKELYQYNIPISQAAALLAIEAIGDDATPSKIARRLSREPHTVSSLLSRMEKKGLVKTSNDLDKKNLVRVVLTKKGLEAYHQSTKRESIYQIMSSLSEEECQQLMSSLQALRDAAWKWLAFLAIGQMHSANKAGEEMVDVSEI